MRKNPLSRRDFIRLGAGATALGAAARVTLLEPSPFWAKPGPVAPSDTVRFGIIGTGVRGCELLQASRRVPGVECVAAADLYDSRHIAAKEALGGKDIFTTREYRQILDRKDIDAVIVATMDHWHRKLVEDAAAAGKDVYCEKPMSHSVEDGLAMVEAIQKNKRMCTVGSQRVSSILYAKAKEIFDSGKLGEVTTVMAAWDRNTPSGAWVYPVPPDASEQTIDWNTFLGGKTKRAFDPVLFFRWRCYKDFGAGLAGDLFVHLISGIQRITGINAVPSRALSTGGLFHFRDGREFPDLIWTMYDYPDTRIILRCNHNNDFEEEFFGFYGKKGTLIIRGSKLTFTPQNKRPEPESYSIYGWPAKLRNEYFAQWRKENPLPAPGKFPVDDAEEVYMPPPGYNDTADHQANFFESVRTRKPVVENEVFGNNTSIVCHMSNTSYFNNAPAVWDAAGKKIKS
ncbi:MAG: Gfo/Idh/MocA family oxidoreductase [Acidobacteria bacterium]|nr:Gfo/Idh/MocA family oxidoreductase [Acidobacteriota bacterium]